MWIWSRGADGDMLSAGVLARSSLPFRQNGAGVLESSLCRVRRGLSCQLDNDTFTAAPSTSLTMDITFGTRLVAGIL